jgi:DNA-binding NtrC family response regulator
LHIATGHVTPPLIGERFARLRSGRWLDLATGQHALVRIAPLDAMEPPEWEGRCAEEVARGDGGPAALIDYGRIGLSHCFEARSAVARHRVNNAGGRAAAAAFAERVAAAARAPGTMGIRVIQPALPSLCDAWELCSLIARRLRPLGYVALNSGADVDRASAHVLSHRHVVVLCLSTAQRWQAVNWVRRLGETSPRAHLVVDASGADPLPVLDVSLRERAPVETGPAAAPSYLQRAATLQGRRRYAAAARALRAAVASAHRRRDPPMQIRSAAQLVALLRRRGDHDAARRAVWRLVRDSPGWPERMDAAAMASRTLIDCAELTDAETLLATVNAECVLRREPVAPILRLLHTELWFWQGRFDRAASEARAVPGPPGLSDGETFEMWRWRALTSWAAGDRRGLDTAAAALAGLPGTRARSWSRALQLLAGAGDDEPDTVAADAERLRSAAADDPLLVAVALEAMLNRGLTAEANAIGDAVDRRERLAPLPRLVIAWLRQAPGAARQRSSPLAREAQRRRMRGLWRWGSGREGMHVVQSLPRLLQIVADAEDDMAALAGVCAWVEEQPGVSMVALLGAEGGIHLAGQPVDRLGIEAGDLEQIARTPHARVIAQAGAAVAVAPVRYAGRTIAALIAQGAAAGAETLESLVGTTAPLCAPAVRARLDALALAASRETLTPEIIGRSPALAAVREAIVRAAATAFPVLIEGESGTGKELVARALHRLSARRDRRFCAVNCAALTDELVEAELFGYARGAFTGAVSARAGLFEEAHQGTLFLDEIRELSARAQAKLLRALQEREIRRLGENAPRAVDVRIVAATNQPLSQAASAGTFREDLVFRLAVIRIRLPPLRERIEDVALLAQAFWRQTTSQTGTRARLGPDALATLTRHAWPGNVRELQNAIAALVVLAPSRGRVTARHVRQVIEGASAGPPAVVPLDDARKAFERQAIAAALARHAGRRAAAARELGLSRQGLLKAIRRLGLDADLGRGVA